jgi:hypothetical protein
MGAAARKALQITCAGASLYSVSVIKHISHFAADIACVSLGKLVE